ncbi:hypothetical protein TEA_000504 [Camellia sinensis var. sinensis]|uniref:Uncharacterized protein n=1 Tax=Camellia sinensis var. sinensis TaxID=542762 RepID=A0A4S4DW97_CAMSN|nr:hypothetical protein TEA_000504 [Camellia sinensis var. sinensis]
MSPMFNEKVRRFFNGSGVASLNSSQNCSRLSSILLVIWQINKLRIESADPTEDAPEMHHVEGAFVETLLPKAKSPSQDALLKLETEQTFTELSQESSMFVFKLGLVKLQCCLLMNGLVVDANELPRSHLRQVHNEFHENALQVPGQRYCPPVEVFKSYCREVRKGCVRPNSSRYYLSFVDQGGEGNRSEPVEPHLVVQMDTESSVLYHKTCLDYCFEKPIKVSYIATALMDAKLGTEGRKDLFDWLSRKLSGLSNFPDADKPPTPKESSDSIHQEVDMVPASRTPFLLVILPDLRYFRSDTPALYRRYLSGRNEDHWHSAGTLASLHLAPGWLISDYETPLSQTGLSRSSALQSSLPSNPSAHIAAEEL